MGYGSSSKDIKEGSALGVAIHSNIQLVEVKAHTTEPNKEEKTYEVLDYIFKNKKGDFFNYRIFNPEAGPEEKLEKAQKDASDKVVYIASKILGKDVELNGENINSWKDFTKEAIALLGDGYSKILLQIKLIGNLYQGRANVQAPNLHNGGWIGGGWIRRMDSKEEKDLVFSEADKKGNAAYDAFVRKGSTSSSPLGSAGTGSPLEDEEVVF